MESEEDRRRRDVKCDQQQEKEIKESSKSGKRFNIKCR